MKALLGRLPLEVVVRRRDEAVARGPPPGTPARRYVAVDREAEGESGSRVPSAPRCRHRRAHRSRGRRRRRRKRSRRTPGESPWWEVIPSSLSCCAPPGAALTSSTMSISPLISACDVETLFLNTRITISSTYGCSSSSPRGLEPVRRPARGALDEPERARSRRSAGRPAARSRSLDLLSRRSSATRAPAGSGSAAMAAPRSACSAAAPPSARRGRRPPRPRSGRSPR